MTPGETRVALLEDGNLTEIFVERGEMENLTGSIYKGRVQRVLPGMQAAFVDIGLKQAAFLYVDNVEDPREDRDDAENTEEEEAPPYEKTRGVGQRIEDLLKEGQDVMVQVLKPPVGTKGARVTTQISLPGRFLVYMPTVNHVGVSRKILSEAERQRLKALVGEIKVGDEGYIARTAAEGVGLENLEKEAVFLKRLWEMVQERYRSHKTPSCIHRDLTITLRSLRDLVAHDGAQRLVIDSWEGCAAVRNFLEKAMPDLNLRIEHYTEEEQIFDAYNLETEIQRALRRKVWLRSGGYIVIDETEALVAIDVNTGRYVGKENFEETILQTNLEAAREIASQIRLRNLCGIIIIDFIDMARPSNQERVYHALVEAVERDRMKTHILPMTELGLVQMTRKRSRKALSRIFCSPCRYCDGRGHTASVETLCFRIYRELLRCARDFSGKSMSVFCHPEIAAQLLQRSRLVLENFEKKTGIPVYVVAEALYHPEQFDVIENLVDKGHGVRENKVDSLREI